MIFDILETETNVIKDKLQEKLQQDLQNFSLFRHLYNKYIQDLALIYLIF